MKPVFLICKKIRENSDVPIIFISARQSYDDVLVALNIGGDDYVKKPYSLSVLLAKVKVVLKRMSVKSNQESSDEKVYKNFELNEDRMSVSLKDKEIPLESREYSLLAYLYEHRNTIVTKEALFCNVWGNEIFSDGTLNMHIRRLREKIEDDPNEPRLIKTILRTGYMLAL